MGIRSVALMTFIYMFYCAHFLCLLLCIKSLSSRKLWFDDGMTSLAGQSELKEGRGVHEGRNIKTGGTGTIVNLVLLPNEHFERSEFTL